MIFVHETMQFIKHLNLMINHNDLKLLYNQIFDILLKLWTKFVGQQSYTALF